MTFRRRAIRTLDRPGGRALLGRAVTYLARQSVPDVRVFYNQGMWMHVSRGTIFVDSPSLDYHPSTFRTWINEFERQRANAEDHWFQVYVPCEGDLIVDVGAGKGEDTATFAELVGVDGRVIAIEAHPITYRCLRMYCDVNDIRNVTSLNYAVVDEPGLVAIGNAEKWEANTVMEAGSDTVAARGITLDEVVRSEQIERIDFLKMNIEGAEGAAIRGMSHTLQITRALCIACHDFLAAAGNGDGFRTKRIVQQAVRAAGFRIVSRDADPRDYISDQVNAIR
jgi:FkbM family methyltransferase